jgi:hypothetical protein
LIANYSLYIDQSEQVTGTLSQTNILQRLHEEFTFGNLKDIADKTIKQLGMGMESPVRVRDVSLIPFVFYEKFQHFILFRFGCRVLT